MNMYAIQGSKGGSVPAVLSGAYNRRFMAEKAIASYLTLRDKPKRTYRRDKSKKTGE